MRMGRKNRQKREGKKRERKKEREREREDYNFVIILEQSCDIIKLFRNINWSKH